MGKEAEVFSGAEKMEHSLINIPSVDSRRKHRSSLCDGPVKDESPTARETAGFMNEFV